MPPMLEKVQPPNLKQFLNSPCAEKVAHHCLSRSRNNFLWIVSSSVFLFSFSPDNSRLVVWIVSSSPASFSFPLDSYAGLVLSVGLEDRVTSKLLACICFKTTHFSFGLAVLCWLQIQTTAKQQMNSIIMAPLTIRTGLARLVCYSLYFIG